MILKKPIQAPDNPHNILEDQMAWARFEYQATRGSMHGLLDYAKRYGMVQAILNDCNRHGVSAPPDSIVKAMAYLLEVPYES
jgi:hypothetical protein